MVISELHVFWHGTVSKFNLLIFEYGINFVSFIAFFFQCNIDKATFSIREQPKPKSIEKVRKYMFILATTGSHSAQEERKKTCSSAL